MRSTQWATAGIQSSPKAGHDLKLSISYYMPTMAYCVYWTRPQGDEALKGQCSRVRNRPWKACSRYLTTKTSRL